MKKNKKQSNNDVSTQSSQQSFKVASRHPFFHFETNYGKVSDVVWAKCCRKMQIGDEIFIIWKW